MCHENPLSHPAPMETCDCICAKEKSPRRLVLSYMCANHYLSFLNHLNAMVTYLFESWRLHDILKHWNVAVAKLLEGRSSYSWCATTKLHVALKEILSFPTIQCDLSIATHDGKMHKYISIFVASQMFLVANSTKSATIMIYYAFSRHDLQ